MHLSHYSARHLKSVCFRAVYVYFYLAAGSAAAEEIDQSRLDKLVLSYTQCIHEFLYCIWLQTQRIPILTMH